MRMDTNGQKIISLAENFSCIKP